MPFKDIIGQGRAVNMLIGAMRMGRVASSYLFQGESGIGKRLTALNFVKALNCLKSVNDACGECISCKKLDAGTHPDFIAVEPEDGQIKVEKIRALEEMLSLKSYEAKVKAVIVDDADMMNASAANAFLKTLEEPPPQSLIVLISSSPDRLPETVRSRCLRINFTPLGYKECMRVLKGLDAAEGRALISMGRPGLALKDDLISKREDFLNDLREMSIKRTKVSWAGKKDIEEWLDTAFVVLRDMAVLKVSAELNNGKATDPIGRSRPCRLINEDIREELLRMSRDLDIKVIINCYERLYALRGYLGFNLNKAVTWNYVGALLRRRF